MIVLDIFSGANNPLAGDLDIFWRTVWFAFMLPRRSIHDLKCNRNQQLQLKKNIDFSENYIHGMCSGTRWQILYRPVYFNEYFILIGRWSLPSGFLRFLSNTRMCNILRYLRWQIKNKIAYKVTVTCTIKYPLLRAKHFLIKISASSPDFRGCFGLKKVHGIRFVSPGGINIESLQHIIHTLLHSDYHNIDWWCELVYRVALHWTIH